METWIIQRIKTRSVRRLVTWILIVVCLGLGAFTQERYIRNFIFGPHELGPADLEAIHDASDTPRYFVRVKGTEVFDTGLQQITIHKKHGVETSRTVSAAYVALLVGQKLLVCKSEAGKVTTIEGALTPMPDSLARELFNTPEMEAIRDKFFPYYLDDEDFRVPGYIAGVGILILALLLFFFALPAWRHSRDPEAHPVARRVQNWGDPIGTAAAVEREFQAPRHKGKGGWMITDNYILQSTFFTFDLFRLSDLLWVHKKVTKHSVNFIPTGKTYAAVLAGQDGTATVEAKEKAIDAMLDFLVGQIPWAVYGYSKEIEEFFRKKPAEFRELVEQRRHESGR